MSPAPNTLSEIPLVAILKSYKFLTVPLILLILLKVSGFGRAITQGEVVM